MELTQLRYFKALAETGSLNKTAEKLYITPPALSSSISRLERELNTTLFDRGRTMVLNERGRIFYEYINQSLEAIENGKRALDEVHSCHQMYLSIGVASAVVWHTMFLDFLKVYPNINLSQQLVNLSDLSSERILSDFDFVIAAPEDLSTESLHSVLLYNNDRPVLMVSKDHPMANLPGVALSDLKEEDFIALSRGTSSRQFFDSLFSVAGFTPHIVVECSPQIRRAFVIEGRGVGIATAHTMQQNSEPGIAFVEITNPVIHRSQALYWHARRFQTQAARLFRTFAVEYFRGGRENSAQGSKHFLGVVDPFPSEK